MQDFHFTGTVRLNAHTERINHTPINTVWRWSASHVDTKYKGWCCMDKCLYFSWNFMKWKNFWKIAASSCVNCWPMHSHSKAANKLVSGNRFLFTHLLGIYVCIGGNFQSQTPFPKQQVLAEEKKSQGWTSTLPALRTGNTLWLRMGSFTFKLIHGLGDISGKMHTRSFWLPKDTLLHLD